MVIGVFVGFVDLLVCLTEVLAPFMLEGSSYIGWHGVGDERLIVVDAI